MNLSNEIKTAILVLSGIFMFIIGFSYLKSNDVFTLYTSKSYLLVKYFHVIFFL